MPYQQDTQDTHCGTESPLQQIIVVRKDFCFVRNTFLKGFFSIRIKTILMIITLFHKLNIWIYYLQKLKSSRDPYEIW